MVYCSETSLEMLFVPIGEALDDFKHRCASMVVKKEFLGPCCSFFLEGLQCDDAPGLRLCFHLSVRFQGDGLVLCDLRQGVCASGSVVLVFHWSAVDIKRTIVVIVVVGDGLVHQTEAMLVCQRPESP